MHVLAPLLAPSLVQATTFVVGAATPSPTPSIDPDLVTPGPWGFVAIAFIALAVTALIYDMLRRIRRARYRSEVAEELDAEERERDARDPDAGP